MIILDTNVVSELMRQESDPAVQEWARSQKTVNLAITTVTIAEIERGLKRLPTGKRRKDLEIRFSSFVSKAFDGRILSFDAAAARCYGGLAAKREAKGLHVDALDLMICAIASDVKASISTRNIGGFDGCGVVLVNPWTGQGKES